MKIIFLILLQASWSWACRSACFGTQDSRYVVKSFDFEVTGGQFFSQASGEAKTALLLSSKLKPLQWTSKYSTISFSQLGPNLPFGGMNEKGLTVEALWLASSQTPMPNKKPAINESQFIQYLLDSAATVDEALRLSNELQIEKAFAAIHYFVCDETEKCLVLQLTQKGLQAHAASSPDDQVIENIAHSEMVKPEKKNWIRETFLKHKQKAKASVGQAFEWLDQVKTSGWSRWQIVYDVKNREVHFQHLDPEGQPGSRWKLKVQNPAAAAKKIVFSKFGAQAWKPEVLKENLHEFAQVFPHFKGLAPVVEKYLEKSY